MTDSFTEASEPGTSATSRPVRVPNVSPGAISGLGHQVIGAAAQDAHDATHGDDPDWDYDGPHIDPDNPDHVDALVAIVPEDRQLAVRQALTGQVIDGQVFTDLDPAPRVEGTQDGADPASALTGDGAPVDATNGALPTDTYTVADYTVDQVNDYLDKYPAATAEVLAAEASGQARVGILHGKHGSPKTAD